MAATNSILMVRPARFGYNAETASDNTYQHAVYGNEVHEKAIQEFDKFVAKLGKKAIDITVAQDTMWPATPDSIFPNNWGSYHSDGTAIIYPMYAENRREERHKNTLDVLSDKFKISQIIDMSLFERRGEFLEGTGSMVLDRDNKIAYACYSERTNRRLFDKYCQAFSYQPVGFHASDELGKAIYHTNVMMCVAEDVAVICLESIVDETEKANLIKSLELSGKKIVPITMSQVRQFAGNMLELAGDNDDRYMVMSDSAYRSLEKDQKKALTDNHDIIHSPLDTIEYVGGGSARCMIAEVFLPKK